MKKQVFNPTTLATPVGHFDRAVQIGPWLFIAGTSALSHLEGEIRKRRLSVGIERQTREAFSNIEKVCEAAGFELADIYEIRFVLKDRDHFEVVDAVLREMLPDKGFIAHGYTGGLLHPDMLVEIEANAYRDLT